MATVLSRMRFVLVSAAGLFSFLLASEDLDARTWRSAQIPNGAVSGCAACHLSPQGGDARNAFGADVEDLVTAGGASNFWGPELAALDSDGDGRTNGEELLDPAGTWQTGDPQPGDTAQVTNPGGNSYVRGDTNADGRVNLADGIYVLDALFRGASPLPCQDAADADSTGNVDLADAVFVVNFLFFSGPQPGAPFPECGGAHQLGCEMAVCVTDGEHEHDHEDDDHEHPEILIGASSEGRLELRFTDEPVTLPPVEGLLSGWASDRFGVVSLTRDDATEGLLGLGAGVEIVLEVVRLDPAFKVYSPGIVDRLVEPGDRWVVGSPPFHVHPAWHIDSEDHDFDSEQAAWSAQVRFLDTGATGYGPSDEYTFMFIRGEPEEHDHEGDDHEGDDHEGDDHEGDDHEGDDHEGDDHEGDDHGGEEGPDA